MDSDDKDAINLNEVVLQKTCYHESQMFIVPNLSLQNEENNVDDDLGLEFYDLDGSEDSSRKVKPATTTTARSAVLKYWFLFPF